MRRSYLIEVPLFYALLFLVERSIVPEHPGFLHFNPHPAWLGVLLFSFRYGSVPGFVAGLLSAGLVLAEIWLWGDHFVFEDPESYLLPGLFIVVGLALGQVVDGLRGLLRKKQTQIDNLTHNVSSIAEELKIQQQVNRSLEKQMVSQMGSLVTLYQGARHLGELNPETLHKGILDFFTQALQAKKAAIYKRHQETWVLSLEKGWEPGDRFKKHLEFREGLIGKAGSENRLISLRDFFGNDVEKTWDGKDRADALLAGPLRKGPKEVIGVYAVQDMPFLKFNSASMNLLGLLLDWAETSIAKSTYFEELKAKSILDEVLNIYNVQYFDRRLEQEFIRSQTYSLPLSVVLVSIPGLAELPVDQQLNHLLATSRILTEICRSIDVVTKFRDAEIPFAVMMITSARRMADDLSQKILDTYEKLGLSQVRPLRIGVGSYDPTVRSKEALIDQATSALR